METRPSKCTHSKTYVAEKLESYPVKDGKDGKDIVINAKIRVCSLCGEELFDMKLDTSNLKEVFDTYRDREGLLLPNEILSIRESLNITQEEMDILTGSSKGSTRRYEAGTIQPVEYNNKLKLISSSEYGRIFHDVLVNDTKEKKALLLKLSGTLQEDYNEVFF